MTTRADSEAERMQRVPGIIFVDGPAGRRARLAGTGLEVFEIIKHYHAGNDDWDELRSWFHWLTEDELRSALRYYELYPEEIDTWLAEEAQLTPERVYAMYPFMRPHTH